MTVKELLDELGILAGKTPSKVTLDKVVEQTGYGGGTPFETTSVKIEGGRVVLS